MELAHLNHAYGAKKHWEIYNYKIGNIDSDVNGVIRDI